MIKQIVTWDLGATKCAAAVVEYNQENKQLTCKKQGSIKIRSCQSLEDLSSQLETMLGMRMQDADAICIGAAGQYNGESLHLDKHNNNNTASHLDKGYPYPMNFASLAKEKNWPKFDIIHDYSPIVCATFTSYLDEPNNVKHLNNTKINPTGRRVALGIGTGVGLKDGVLFENGDFWLGTNEMGHIGVTTPPLADKIHHQRHEELIKFLRSEKVIKEDEALTFEKILAGPGLGRLHAFFDRSVNNHCSEKVGELVKNGHADETLAMFAWYVGLLVGTIQLTFMPDGGIWITGGVVLNNLNLFDQKEFFQGIEASPNYFDLRQRFPLGVLCGTEHAFMGGAYYAAQKLL